MSGYEMLNEEQKKAYNSMMSGRNLFVTGELVLERVFFLMYL